MFDLKEAYSNITLEDIYNKVSDYQLWKYYCKNFEELDKSFKSEFYTDSNPGCRIYTSTNNKLRYKDFGTGENYSVIEYIQKKYNCTFKECLNIISNDFNISNNQITINKQQPLIQLEETIINRPKAKINILPKPFTLIDYNYWNQYKIPLTLLEEYNVYSCKYVALIKGDKIINFESTNSNPIYAYRFCNDGEYTYKIYFPYADKKHKWLFSGGSSKDIEGYDQLNLHGNILILTKSLKDCMCYRLLGYDAISLQGETNKLEQSFVDKLLKRFDNILVNYDNDEEGIKGAKRLNIQFGFKYFFIDGAKDLSDYIKLNGLNNAKQQIDDKIKDQL
jgi:hypothetical protein